MSEHLSAPARRSVGTPRHEARPAAPRRTWALAGAAGLLAAALALAAAPNKGPGPIEIEGDEELQQQAALFLDGVESRAQALVVLHRDTEGSESHLAGGTVDGQAAPDRRRPARKSAGGRLDE